MPMLQRKHPWIVCARFKQTLVPLGEGGMSKAHFACGTLAGTLPDSCGKCRRLLCHSRALITLSSDPCVRTLHKAIDTVMDSQFTGMMVNVAMRASQE